MLPFNRTDTMVVVGVVIVLVSIDAVNFNFIKLLCVVQRNPLIC